MPLDVEDAYKSLQEDEWLDHDISEWDRLTNWNRLPPEVKMELELVWDRILNNALDEFDIKVRNAI